MNESELLGDKPYPFKSGYACILGEPNAGKSTLLNAILGEKLSIVTPKPQTTRKQVLGIFTDEKGERPCQIIFIDTPGIMKPKYKLHKAMLKFADDALDDADALALVIDAKLYSEKRRSLKDDLAFQRLADVQKPKILTLNKIDLLRKEDVLLLIDRLSKEAAFDEIVPLSALKAFNVSELIKAIYPYLPCDKPFYPSDILSVAPERFFVSEIAREKIFTFFRKEIPYSTEVVVEAFEENHEKNPKRKDVIRCAIVVERESQKAILIGEGGAAIRKIGEAARRDIEAFLRRPVYLELFVKVRENWREREAQLREFGYR
ncbi:MAG: GTPase Era [Chloroherpetonaceae bacterium]|nr:GTPase Era [Chloroherpetonaceae bacterium]MDW8437383.1 GTPase Era [Chloroherpetonaceae bacterium]